MSGRLSVFIGSGIVGRAGARCTDTRRSTTSLISRQYAAVARHSRVVLRQRAREQPAIPEVHNNQPGAGQHQYHPVADDQCAGPAQGRLVGVPVFDVFPVEHGLATDFELHQGAVVDRGQQ